MMQYDVEYKIVKGHYSDSSSKNIAVIGIFATSSRVKIPDCTDLEEGFITEKSITLKSNLGGGAGFPVLSRVVDSFVKEHSQSIKDFILSIEEEQILLFNSLEIYSYALIGIICKQLNDKKHIVCMIDKYPSFLGQRRVYEASLKEIEQYSDELILLNIAEEITNQNKSATLPAFNILRNNIHKDRVKFYHVE